MVIQLIWSMYSFLPHNDVNKIAFLKKFLMFKMGLGWTFGNTRMCCYLVRERKEGKGLAWQLSVLPTKEGGTMAEELSQSTLAIWFKHPFGTKMHKAFSLEVFGGKTMKVPCLLGVYMQGSLKQFLSARPRLPAARIRTPSPFPGSQTPWNNS